MMLLSVSDSAKFGYQAIKSKVPARWDMLTMLSKASAAHLEIVLGKK